MQVFKWGAKDCNLKGHRVTEWARKSAVIVGTRTNWFKDLKNSKYSFKLQNQYIPKYLN